MPHIRYAKKLRTVALVTAALLLLGSASASAAGKIGGNGIKKNAIAAKHIKDNAVQSSEIKNGAVASGEIKDSSVASGDIKNGTVGSGDITDSTIASGDIKQGAVGSSDLANGSVTAAKLAPGAVAFPNSLWGTSLRNQVGAAQSQVQAGPGGQPLGDGSLRLFTAGATDIAAFGNPVEFAAFELADIDNLSYETYNADASPITRPSLRIEINPHLVADDTVAGLTEFATIVHQPANGPMGWDEHTGILDDSDWYLSGQEGEDIECTQASQCTFTELRDALITNVDADGQPPAISTSVYFGLGAGPPTPTETAVDAFVFNDFQFDFEPMGVFLTPAP